MPSNLLPVIFLLFLPILRCSDFFGTASCYETYLCIKSLGVNAVVIVVVAVAGRVTWLKAAVGMVVMIGWVGPYDNTAAAATGAAPCRVTRKP